MPPEFHYEPSLRTLLRLGSTKKAEKNNCYVKSLHLSVTAVVEYSWEGSAFNAVAHKCQRNFKFGAMNKFLFTQISNCKLNFRSGYVSPRVRDL